MEFRRVEGRQRNCANTWETSNERLDCKRRSAAVVVCGGGGVSEATQEVKQRSKAVRRLGQKELEGNTWKEKAGL